VNRQLNTNKHGLTLGSLFDGIGGFPYAASFFGIKPLWASEILPQAVSVTKLRFPDMEHLGDITKLDGAKLKPVDIASFGSPCQDLSTAGKRAGMSAQRSGLFYEAIRIIDEMREATNGKYPKYAIWENVPGALSSGNPRGSDFRAVLEAFAKTEIPIPDSKEWANSGMVRSDRVNLAWAVRNAQYYGVPQRRRRIFLVASFGKGRADEILFIEESLRGYSAPSRQAGQGTARDAQRSAFGAMYDGSGVDCIKTCLESEARSKHTGLCLGSDDGNGSGNKPTRTKNANCLNPWETQQLRVFTEEGVSPAMAGADGGGGRNPAGLVFAAFCGGASAKSRSIGYSEEISPTLKAEASGLTPPCVCEPIMARTLTARGGSPNICGGPNVVAYGIAALNSNSMLSDNPQSGCYLADKSKTLDTNGVNPCANQGGMAIVSGKFLNENLNSGKALNENLNAEKPNNEKQNSSKKLKDKKPNAAAMGVHQNQAGDVSVSDTAYTVSTTSNASSRNAPLVAYKNLNGKDTEKAFFKAAGISSKGSGDCFLTPECHYTLSAGGGMAGQGYPAALVSVPCNGACSGIFCSDMRSIIPCSDSCSILPCSDTHPDIACSDERPDTHCSGVHPDIAGTLCASGAGLSRPAGMASETDLCVVETEKHRHKQSADLSEGIEDCGQCGYKRPVYALQGNMINRQDHNGPMGSGVNEDISFTLTSADVCGIAAKLKDDGRTAAANDGDKQTSDRISVFSHRRSDIFKEQGVVSAQTARQNKAAADSAYENQSVMDIPSIPIYNRQGVDIFKEQDIACTQIANQHKLITHLICENHPVADISVSAVDCRNHKEIGDMSGTLQAKDKQGYSLNYQNPVRCGYIVRRLTPTECERLQGFEDGWTAYGHDGKEISDTRRYQMLGNSVAIPCVVSIFGGIVAVESRLKSD